VLTREEAARHRAAGSITVLEPDGFAIFAPWISRITTPEGVSGEELAVGPAVVGRVMSTPRGARVVVGVRRYAPAPSQRARITMLLVVVPTLLLAFPAVTGGHVIALVLSAIVGAGLAGSVLLTRWGERARDIRELLAVVERTFGPHEIDAHDDSPHRRKSLAAAAVAKK
jgi:hypothetical protein